MGKRDHKQPKNTDFGPQKGSLWALKMVPFRVLAGLGDPWGEPGSPEARPGGPRDRKLKIRDRNRWFWATKIKKKGSHIDNESDFLVINNTKLQISSKIKTTSDIENKKI